MMQNAVHNGLQVGHHWVHHYRIVLHLSSDVHDVALYVGVTHVASDVHHFLAVHVIHHTLTSLGCTLTYTLQIAHSCIHLHYQYNQY